MTLQQAEGRKLTPMLRRYIDAKKQCPDDSILLFRMGDFFELSSKMPGLQPENLISSLQRVIRNLKMLFRWQAFLIIPSSSHGWSARLLPWLFVTVTKIRSKQGRSTRDCSIGEHRGHVSDLDSLGPTSRAYLACVEPASTDGMWCLGFLDMLAGEIIVTECAKATLIDELRRMVSP